ncbi:DMT family transporter [Castellaniella sp.]|uniref:DMT family transporter n=1 Tax=Castellaniella sp. TaxID=1955812 RepID=UPI00356A3134
MDTPGEARPWLGPVLMCLVSLFFALLDAATKYLAADYPLTQVVWFRYVVQTAVLALVFLPRIGLSLLHTHSPLLQLLRGLSLCGASILAINGLARLPLAETSAILFMAPLIVTLLSGLILKEKASRMDWAAIGLGFVGVLIIVRPGGGLMTWAVFFPMGAAACNACYQVVTRFTRVAEHPVTSNLYTGAIGTAVLLPLMPYVWQPMAATDVLIVCAAGAIGATGHLLFTKALSVSSVVVLSPYSYFQLMFASVLGWTIFETVPDAMSWLGILVIAAGGLMISLGRLVQRGAARLHSGSWLR